MEQSNRPTVARIHINHLRHNLKQLQAKLPTGQDVMGIVKANAYGHGAAMIARTLESSGIKKFGVATFQEGMELREKGMRAEIYVLDGIMAPLQDYFSNRLTPVVYELSHLKSLSEFAAKEGREINIALKFDTGMCRLGLPVSQVDDIVACLTKTSKLKVTLILTHLAKADEMDDVSTKRQYVLFRKLRDILRDRDIHCPCYSICNSAATIDGLFEDFNLIRPGIAVYGCYPNPRFNEKINLLPVMELCSGVFSLKTVPPNTSVGYGATFTTTRESKIAILPIGYADGYPRLVSNRGHVLVRGQKAPIVGRISMDLMAIDVTDVGGVALQDPVTLIGQNGNLTIRAEDVANWAETISYEVLCGISQRVPRIYEGL